MLGMTSKYVRIWGYFKIRKTLDATFIFCQNSKCINLEIPNLWYHPCSEELTIIKVKDRQFIIYIYIYIYKMIDNL